MTKEELKQRIQKGIVYLDGATGSNLQAAGMETGVCPEKWILEHPEVLVELQKRYFKAGSQIVLAPTFTGNRMKLKEYGLEDQIQEINHRLVQLSRQAAGSQGYVAGDMTMTGEQLYPMGTLLFEELVEVYKEQVKYLVEAGVDLFFVETMMSLQETRAAVLAIRESCNLPIIASMTYGEDGRTLYGTDPITAAVVLQSLSVDVIGVNCSSGPKEMIPMIEQIKSYTNLPILAKPNAGLPELMNGESVYAMTPKEFASYGEALVKAGASLLGGCCGTTPEHIQALYQQTSTLIPPITNKKKYRVVASERQSVFFEVGKRFHIIGERINPTGKKALQAELREGCFDRVLEMAEEQEENGASLLDVNMGMNGIDEKERMIEAIYQIGMASNLPLCIDSSHVEVIEAALRIYSGRALINSISLEREKIEQLLPIAKKYGAMFILLPLSDKGLPVNMEEKKKWIGEILDRAYELGFTKEDVIVDGLVATVGANKKAALETLETIRYCKEELDLCTVCGLSNISFGLPERSYINSTFLTMAIANGLTMAIANPMQELLMNVAYASELLLNKKEGDLRYIERMNQRKIAKDEEKTDNISITPTMPKVYECVLKGNKNSILREVDAELALNRKAGDIINNLLIPAINQVGLLFEQQKYFLPQLISSAEAMKTAIEYLEPMLEQKDSKTKMPTIVIATVEGDIHDIGKNLVVLMLKNYGYKVIDLGKDVSKERIIEAAIQEKADIIGLSALMTTTMMRMKDVVDYRNQLNLKVKIIIGGAVITKSFAEEIGADGYSKDAADAVKLVQSLMEEER